VTTFGKTAGLIIAAAFALTLAGCGGSGPSGTYGDLGKNGMQFIFDGGGKVTVKFGGLLAGIVSQGTYKVDGKEINIFDPAGRGMTLTIDDNGCLTGGMITGAACAQ